MLPANHVSYVGLFGQCRLQAGASEFQAAGCHQSVDKPLLLLLSQVPALLEVTAEILGIGAV